MNKKQTTVFFFMIFFALFFLQATDYEGSVKTMIFTIGCSVNAWGFFIWNIISAKDSNKDSVR